MSVSYRIQEIDCIASGRAVLLAFEVVIRLWGECQYVSEMVPNFDATPRRCHGPSHSHFPGGQRNRS
jgi:hypothetical protein